MLLDNAGLYLDIVRASVCTETSAGAWSSIDAYAVAQAHIEQSYAS